MPSNKQEFVFRTIQGAENNKKWSWYITFGFHNAKLWDHVNGSARRPLELKKLSDDNEDRKECIYQQREKIQDFDLKIIITIAKISKICSDIV